MGQQQRWPGNFRPVNMKVTAGLREPMASSPALKTKDTEMELQKWPGYVYPAKIEIDAARHEHIVASFYGPGDWVRPNPHYVGTQRGLPEHLKTEETKLQVKTVIVLEDSSVNFEFEGMEGIYNGAAVTDVRDIEHTYGALIREADSTWVVALDPNSEEPKAGKVYRIEGDPERYVQWNQGIKNEAELAEWAAQDGGCVGEFNMVANGDAWTLVGIPWATMITAQERKAAAEAVAGDPRPSLSH